MKNTHIIVSSGIACLALTGLAAAQKMSGKMDMSRYGGPVYNGKPALTVTASLVQAGGGPAHFSVVKALTSMNGAAATKMEVAKLTKQYGPSRITRFVKVFAFAVADALKIATSAGVKLPKGNLSGKALQRTLIQAGMDKDGTFYTEFVLDKAVTHKIHDQVMLDIDQQFGEEADMDYHRISNQEHYDTGWALHVRGIKLAKLH